MSDFHALTLALEGWFTTPLCDLPDALRQRVEKEFPPMPWDQLSAEQRRTVALQLDYQHDPAAEANRQFWWDHYLPGDRGRNPPGRSHRPIRQCRPATPSKAGMAPNCGQ